MAIDSLSTFGRRKHQIGGTDPNQEDIKECYEVIKKARIIRKQSVVRRTEGTTYTNIPMAMWEVLQPVIENEIAD